MNDRNRWIQFAAEVLRLLAALVAGFAGGSAG